MHTPWNRPPPVYTKGRQTLSRADESNLTIQKNLIQTQDGVSMHRSSSIVMLDLPEEILSGIIELAITDQASRRGDGPYNKSKIPALAYTCRQFCRLVLPFNYHSLRLSFPRRMIYPVCSTRKLVRTLEADTELSVFCRELTIRLSNVCPGRCKTDCECLGPLLPSFRNVKALNLKANFESSSQHSWEMIERCAQHMPRLQTLCLSAEHLTGPTVVDVLQNLKIPTLKALNIRGTSKSTMDLSLLAIEMGRTYNTSNLTSLSLHSFHGKAIAIGAFLSWPKALSEFSLWDFRFDPSHADWHPNYLDMRRLSDMLVKHKNTLRTLSVGSLSPAGTGKLADLTDFTALEELRLSRWQLHTDLNESFESPAQLLAPNLKHFIWEIEKPPSSDIGWSEFGTGECKWLTSLAEAAVKKRAALQEIEIRFMPQPPTPEDGATDPARMVQELDHRFRSQGIAFTYDKPRMSKEDMDSRKWSTD